MQGLAVAQNRIDDFQKLSGLRHPRRRISAPLGTCGIKDIGGDVRQIGQPIPRPHIALRLAHFLHWVMNGQGLKEEDNLFSRCRFEQAGYARAQILQALPILWSIPQRFVHRQPQQREARIVGECR